MSSRPWANIGWRLWRCRAKRTENEMGSDSIRVLLVEDDEDDYFLTRDLFCEISGNSFHLDWIKNYAAALEMMQRNQHDVYLLDYRLDGHNGLDLLREARVGGCRAPIILLTG